MLRKIPLIQLPRRYVWLWEKWRTAVCEKDFEQSRAFYPFNAEHRLCDLYGLPAQLFGKIMDEIFMEINVPTHYSNWMLKNSRPFHIVKIENMIFLDFSWGNSSSAYAQFSFHSYPVFYNTFEVFSLNPDYGILPYFLSHKLSSANSQ